jgi:hypothetical protein
MAYGSFAVRCNDCRLGSGLLRTWCAKAASMAMSFAIVGSPAAYPGSCLWMMVLSIPPCTTAIQPSPSFQAASVYNVHLSSRRPFACSCRITAFLSSFRSLVEHPRMPSVHYSSRTGSTVSIRLSIGNPMDGPDFFAVTASGESSFLRCTVSSGIRIEGSCSEP